MIWVALPTLTGMAKGSGGGDEVVDVGTVDVLVVGAGVVVDGGVLRGGRATLVVEGPGPAGVAGTTVVDGWIDVECWLDDAEEGEDDAVEVAGGRDDVVGGGARLDVRVGGDDGAEVVDRAGARLLGVVLVPFAAASGGTVTLPRMPVGCVLEIFNAAGELVVRVWPDAPDTAQAATPASRQAPSAAASARRIGPTVAARRCPGTPQWRDSRTS